MSMGASAIAANGAYLYVLNGNTIGGQRDGRWAPKFQWPARAISVGIMGLGTLGISAAQSRDERRGKFERSGRLHQSSLTASAICRVNDKTPPLLAQ